MYGCFKDLNFVCSCICLFGVYRCLTSCSRIFHKSRSMPGDYGPWARRPLYRASPIMTCLKGHTLRKLKPGRVNCPLAHNVSKRQRDLSVWTCLMSGHISSSDKHVTKTYIILSYVKKIYVFTNPLQRISAIITKYGLIPETHVWKSPSCHRYVDLTPLQEWRQTTHKQQGPVLRKGVYSN